MIEKEIKFDEDNFIETSKKFYINNHFISEKEFEKDLKRPIKHIKSLFRKVVCGKNVNSLLIINHFKLLFNLFEEEFLYKLLFYKIEDYYHPQLKSCLKYLKTLPKTIKFNDKIIYLSDIKSDEKLYKNIQIDHKNK